MSRYALRIGGVTISVEGDETFDIADPTARFLVSPGSRDDVDIIVKRGRPQIPRGELLFDSGGVWRLYRDGDRNVFTFSSPSFPSDPYKTASFDDAFTRGEVMLSDDVPRGADPLAYPLDELLVASILGRGAGVELHGVGIVVDGRGMLFVGQSGAGKTTTARLWINETSPTILSDDRIIVRRVNGAFRMFGTPWHGEAEICSAEDVPLSGIYLLKQYSQTEVHSLDAAEAVARLFSCCFPLFYWPESIEITLAFLATIAGERIVHELAFRPDASAVQAIVRSGRQIATERS